MNIHKISTKSFTSLKTVEERIKYLLRYAVLAPSTHNSQPWLFKIKGNKCEIHLNKEKKIPYADPKGRDMYISLGCCIENFLLAAKYFGVFDNLEIVLKKELVAIVTIKSKVLKSKNKEELRCLVKTITNRQNKRGSYNKNCIPSFLLNSISKIANDYKGVCLEINTNRETINEVSRLTGQSVLEAYRKEEFRKEIIKWFIGNKSLKKEGIPGYSLLLPSIISKIFPIVINKINLGPLISFMTTKKMNTSRALFIFSSKNDTKKDWVMVGRFAERAMLELQEKKLSTSIYVAAIEGSKSHRKELKKILRIDGRPQFLFGAGYMSLKIKHTPRYNVEEKIVN